jgi:3-oxoacyl-[acyl-carrier-protein] synthase-1
VTNYLTALGIACSLGVGKPAVAKALFEGRANYLTHDLLSGKTVPIAPISFDLPNLPTEFKILNSKNNRLLRLALNEIAEDVAVVKKKYGAARIGVVMATSTSGMLEEEKGFAQKYLTGEWPENHHYAQFELASPSVFAAQYFSLSGTAYTVSTACSSGGKAICSARRLINAGICDAVITGGVDTLCDLTLNGFDSLALLSEKICNPLSKNRNGITIGEGAAVFLMTREKIADIAIEFKGGGETSDAHHISSPDPTGKGASDAITAALKMADMNAQEIAYINLHGTGTQLNDTMEAHSIYQLFGDAVYCSSTKALTGHTLGAAGAIEAAFLWLALAQEQDGTIPLPPHIWDGELDSLLPVIRLAHKGDRASAINHRFALMSNSFAFGGSNVSVILSKVSG